MTTSQNEERHWSRLQEKLPGLLPDFLRNQRWFGGKAHNIRSAQAVEAIPVRNERLAACIIMVRVEYDKEAAETYVLPLMRLSVEQKGAMQKGDRGVPILRIGGESEEEDANWIDALWDRDFSRLLLDAIARRLSFKGILGGEILGLPTPAFAPIRGEAPTPFESSLMNAEQSNTSIVYGDRLILKLFRRIQEGTNPDVEIGSFLTERTSFRSFAPVAGTIAYRRGGEEPKSLAILQAFVPNQGDAWKHTLEALRQYFERLDAGRPAGRCAPVPSKPLLTLIEEDAPQSAYDLIGCYLESARLLGRRTAELHLALASDIEDPNFAPEPFSPPYQQWLRDSMIGLTGQVFQLLRSRVPHLPEAACEPAHDVLNLEEEIVGRFRTIFDRKITAVRIRIHGDYHLGQVLSTGQDFVIIDFEGEPARPMGERRIKHSPLRDVAGMLRSFHYAAYAALSARGNGAAYRKDISALERWAHDWQLHVCATFLKSYLAVAGEAPFLPRNREELKGLLNAYLLEKATYELGYELNNRPSWVKIPLLGILQILGNDE